MDALDPDTFEFPSGNTPSCGNRRDLPKKERRHIWLDAGRDIRHRFSGEYGLSLIKICRRCGRDEGTSAK